MLDLLSADGRIDHPVQAFGFLLTAALAALVVGHAAWQTVSRRPAGFARELARPEAGFAVLILVLAVLQLLHARGLTMNFLFRPEVGDGGLVEHLTVALLMVPAIVLVYRTLARRRGSLRVPLALGAALIGLIAAGEEISWGQHWLGFAPPETVAQTNLQGEFNLHNYITPARMEALYFAAALGLMAVAANLDTLLGRPGRRESQLGLKALIALAAVLMAHHLFQEVAELGVVLAGAWIYAGLDRGAFNLKLRPLAGLMVRPG